jgi:hypothetical protein
LKGWAENGMRKDSKTSFWGEEMPEVRQNGDTLIGKMIEGVIECRMRKEVKKRDT